MHHAAFYKQQVRHSLTRLNTTSYTLIVIFAIQVDVLLSIKDVCATVVIFKTHNRSYWYRIPRV